MNYPPQGYFTILVIFGALRGARPGGYSSQDRAPRLLALDFHWRDRSSLSKLGKVN
jgi:hypothetical protein